MKIATTGSALLILVSSSVIQAQNQNHLMMQQQMQSHQQMQRDQMNFPSATEMRMMSPMTEKKINERFAIQKANLQKIIDNDKKAAAKYAEDFAKYQKSQADQLKKMMTDADKQRAKTMENLELQHQMALQHLKKMQEHRQKAQQQ